MRRLDRHGASDGEKEGVKGGRGTKKHVVGRREMEKMMVTLVRSTVRKYEKDWCWWVVLGRLFRRGEKRKDRTKESDFLASHGSSSFWMTALPVAFPVLLRPAVNLKEKGRRKKESKIKEREKGVTSNASPRPAQFASLPLVLPTCLPCARACRLATGRASPAGSLSTRGRA